MEMWTFVMDVWRGAWDMLVDSAVYVLFGLLVGGILLIFLSPASVARHLGRGRFGPVFKAALFGIPLPLCSCGVLPAAASLKKQGANKGATAAFLIATPESGIDSIAISYALLDPLMTVARPLVAFVSAITAGIGTNLLLPPRTANEHLAAPPADDAPPLPWHRKIVAGLRYAHDDVWGDMAGWFFLGLLAAGLITALVPTELIGAYLGGGLPSMLLMLAIGIPLYICATASTPIAAALILKGVSPGAALVFLLVGPATNIASLSVLLGILGKRATALYLLAISGVSVIAGLLLDWIYQRFQLPITAVIGQADEALPPAIHLAATGVLLLLSIKPLIQKLRRLAGVKRSGKPDCGCGGACAAPIFPAPPERDRKG